MFPSTRILAIPAAALVLAVALLTGLTPASQGRDVHPAAGGARYVVRSGDTLWSIARRRYPSDDPRAAVYRIQQANHVDPAALQAGAVLVLP